MVINFLFCTSKILAKFPAGGLKLIGLIAGIATFGALIHLLFHVGFPLSVFLILPQGLPLRKGLQSDHFLCYTKRIEIVCFSCFLAFQRGELVWNSLSSPAYPGRAKAPPPPFWRTWAFTAWTICLWPSSPTSPACAWPGPGTGKYGRVALVTDIRGGQTFDELFQALDGLREMHLDYQLLFIEAADEDIVRGTRRPATPTPSPARATPCRRR